MWHIIKQIARTGVITETVPATDEGLRVAVAPALPALAALVHPCTAAGQIHADILTILGRALTIRHVDAGSCNGCELEIHALGNPYYNIEGLGIRFAASPRHADLLLVTGPVSRHMEEALRLTFEAMPAPRLVVAVGDCGSCGGIFGEGYASCGRIANVIPVDVAVPGCPPPPLEILRGVLTAVRERRG